jgi:RNA polymerase sigma factor (sigma-70 family)
MEAAAHGSEPAPARPRAPLRGRLLRGSSDDRLVARIRAGDERAFEVLFDEHHRGLLSFCRHMLGSREEAEDAVQHALLQAYRSLRATDGEVRLKPWLYTIARNRCLSVLRARRDEVSLDDAPPSVDGLAASVQRREDLQALLADIGRLPEEQREALVLFELGDLPHEEIADVLGVRKEKVKALVFQARESLMASRTARETPCAEIREQLSTLRGASLRRGPLRRHVEQCPACQAFEAEVRRQRAAMALLLPVVPTVAFKSGVLGAFAGAAHAGAGAGAGAAAGAAGAGGVATTGAGTLAAAGGKGLLAKALVALAIAGGAGGGGFVAVHEISKPATSHGHGTHHAPAITRSSAGAASTRAGGAAAAHGTGVRAHGPGRGLAQGHAKHHGKGKALGHNGVPVTAAHGRGATGARGRSGTAGSHSSTPVRHLRARRRGLLAPKRHTRHVSTAPRKPAHTPPPTSKAPAKPPATTTTPPPTTTTTTPSSGSPDAGGGGGGGTSLRGSSGK